MFLYCCLGAFCWLWPAYAQSSRQRDNPSHLQFEGLGTLANGDLQGVTRDRKLTDFEVAYRRTFMRRSAVVLDFKTAIVPLAILREPFLIGTDTQALKNVPPATETRRSFGLGAKPAGLVVSFLPRHRWQPFVEFDGGLLYFNRNVMSARAAQFNFTGEGRVGLRFSIHNGDDLSAGYGYLHMSNGYTAHENPGMDAHALFFSYSIPFPRRASPKH
jgi:hypothetical protein